MGYPPGPSLSLSRGITTTFLFNFYHIHFIKIGNTLHFLCKHALCSQQKAESSGLAGNLDSPARLTSQLPALMISDKAPTVFFQIKTVPPQLELQCRLLTKVIPCSSYHTQTTGRFTLCQEDIKFTSSLSQRLVPTLVCRQETEVVVPVVPVTFFRITKSPEPQWSKQ